MRFRATFQGRKLGAIGVFHPIVTDTYGENRKAAELALYDRFQDVHGLNLDHLPPVKCAVCGEDSPTRSSHAGHVHRWGPRDHHFEPFDPSDAE